ncbi:hypothetical protein QVD17_11738 [Tagetes erecta]|uniref:F-box associated beta-propeller type 1 domain-containing protein n=1 Tax=Tagetes erecta TaxID=13708 RepID=A0AAD8P2B6_TARER|nr:hypothetical protein QVD17_11738 [Tagetes erecta]
MQERVLERTLPPVPARYTPSSFWALCFGFGYDSSTDDYKVVLGLRKSEYVTCFVMLTLKFNVWKFIGEIKYKFNYRIGTLCNGALHWPMFHENHQTSNVSSNTNMKLVTVSFDLSEHHFKEMSPPDDDDPLYKSLNKYRMMLGIMGERLCIFRPITFSVHHEIWIMNKYNVKESWRMVGPHDCWKEPQSQLLLRSLVFTGLRSHKLFERPYIRMCKNCWEIGSPIYVRSLVSPHTPFLTNPRFYNLH